MSEFINSLNLVLAADDRYAQHLGVTLVSIAENYRGSRRLFFHIFDDHIGAVNKARLNLIGEQLAKNKTADIKIIFYNISVNLLADCPEVNHLSRATYARLLAPELLPLDIDKIIYLDADIVALGNIAELYDQDLSGCSLGAVSDVMAEEILRIYFYPGLVGYFNAGVLLISLNAWRQKRIKERSWQFINQHFPDLIRSDQDVLNCLFKDDWKLLDSRFNVDLKRRGFRVMPAADAVILHYSDRVKPDSYLFAGLSGRYYHNYLQKTPFRDFKITDYSVQNFFKKYGRLLIRGLKRAVLPYLPSILTDAYRRLLWRTYRVKKRTIRDY